MNPVPDLTPSFPSRKSRMLGPDPYLPLNIFLGVLISQWVKVWIREAVRPSLIKPCYYSDPSYMVIGTVRSRIILSLVLFGSDPNYHSDPSRTELIPLNRSVLG